MINPLKVLLIGCGAMGSALDKGWREKGTYAVTIIDPHVPGAFARLDLLNPSYHPDVILFAVKPQVIHDVIPEYGAFAKAENPPLFLSIMAGVPIETIEHLLGCPAKIIRAMPNLPAVVGQGVTGLVATCPLDPHHLTMGEELFAAVGHVVWLESEEKINAVTAISGSGPAYFFQLAESLTKAGVSLGLTEVVAKLLAQQTLIGAGELLKNSKESAAEWKAKVTSPGGTTASALAVFESNGLTDLVEKATMAAFNRSIELSKT